MEQVSYKGFVMKEILQPHYEERNANIDMIVYHCSVCNPEQMIKVLDEARLSAHYIIGTDGDIIRLVKDEKKAWHAGMSYWQGRKNLNCHSIGIELCSPSFGQNEYTGEQINSLIKLSKELIDRYNIPAHNIVGHSDIAPIRKPDPGIAFPWKKLADNGIGLWYDIKDAQKIQENDVEVLLDKIGYETVNLAASAYAFCRHFIPNEVYINHNYRELAEAPYNHNFKLNNKYLDILKACCYIYTK